MNLKLTSAEFGLLKTALKQYHLAAVIATTWQDAPRHQKSARRMIPRIERLKAKLEQIND